MNNNNNYARDDIDSLEKPIENSWWLILLDIVREKIFIIRLVLIPSHVL